MLIDLLEVLKSDGKMIQTDAGFEADVYDAPFGSYPVTDRTPVSLTITNKGKKHLQIQGHTELVLRVPCDRCLEEVEVPFRLEFDREADLNPAEEVPLETLDEQFYIEGYHLDVDKLVCSEILVSWPSKILCREDCKGLCRICGTNLNLRTCGCRTADLDPRMAQIQEIFSKFKEV